jgi:hypothetical protein
MAAFNEAHDEADAAEGEDLSEDEGAPEAVAEAPEPSVCPGDYLDGREDEDELDLPRLGQPAPVADEPEPEDGGEGE